jgi:hypothetical protein
MIALPASTTPITRSSLPEGVAVNPVLVRPANPRHNGRGAHNAEYRRARPRKIGDFHVSGGART